jgi:hypothetical protein
VPFGMATKSKTINQDYFISRLPFIFYVAHVFFLFFLFLFSFCKNCLDLWILPENNTRETIYADVSKSVHRQCIVTMFNRRRRCPTNQSSLCKITTITTSTPLNNTQYFQNFFSSWGFSSLDKKSESHDLDWIFFLNLKLYFVINI